MAETNICPDCGSVIPAGTPPGSCPGCLLLLVVEGEEPADARVSVPPTKSTLTTEGQGDFPDYELIEEIGRGGMGIVWKARQLSLNRIVALKMIGSGNFADAQEVQRFRTEAEAAASLDHSNIVPIYEVGEDASRHYFTMKWVEGRNLAQTVSAPPGSTKELSVAARLMVQIAQAVHHAHQRGLLHRDLKPANILIDQQGQALVTDFGLAKRLAGSLELTASGVIMGTPSYMSPEQAGGNAKKLTIASDIFSLGAILYFLLTGRPPFNGDGPVEIIRNVVEKEPPNPSLLNPTIDKELATICLKCLEKDPSRRYASAGTLAEDLENWLQGKPINARPVSDCERARKWIRRHPAISTLSIAVMVSLILGLAGVSVEWRRAERERAKTAKANVRLELQRAEDFLAGDKSHLALATLSALVRQSPTNRAAAERLINALNQQVFLVPTVTHEHPFTNQADLSPDGKLRVRLEGTDKNSFRIEDLKTGGTSTSIEAHDVPIRSANFSSDAQRLVTSSSDKTAKVWDTKTMGNLLTLHHEQGVNWAEFSPDGSRIVTATEGFKSEARLWDASSGQRLGASMRHFNAINTARFDSDGHRIVTASDDRTVRVWNGFTGEPLSAPTGLSEMARDARFSTNDAVIVAGNRSEVRSFGLTVRARFERAESAELPTRSDAGTDPALLESLRRKLSPKHSGEITSLAIGPQRNIVATASKDRTARLWDLRSLAPLVPPLIHNVTVNCVRFSPDGLRLVTSTARPAQVRIWEVQTGDPLSDWFDASEAVPAVQFSQDGCWIITAAPSQWKWRLWPVLGPAPGWLPELGEAIAGLRYGASGTAEPVKREAFFELRTKLLTSTDSSPLNTWAKEFLNAINAN